MNVFTLFCRLLTKNDLMRLIGVVFIFFNFTLTAMVKADTVSQIIKEKKAAVTVSPVRLYGDSSYTKNTSVIYNEGELFEIIGETKLEHPDNTQTQTFKWYKVRSLEGQTGWIYGDNLAVVMPENTINATLKPLFKTEAHFDNGFENAMLWVGSVEGHDDHNPTDRKLNPTYKEFYIIITNDKGKSSCINYSNSNESGSKTLQNIHLKDVTDNKINDIIIETSTLPTGKDLEEHYLEIYSFKAGALEKIFEERLTLLWEEDMPSPSYSKFVEIEGSEIRIAYVNYMPCDKYSLGLQTDIRSKTLERCLEYTTCSYMWDKIEKTFKPLYKESHTPLSIAISTTTFLRKTPSITGEKIASLPPDERLIAIKHFDFIKSEKSGKKVENWLYVKHPSGIYGYILATDIVFKNIEHASILKDYYTKTPLLKQSWKCTAEFLSVKE